MKDTNNPEVFKYTYPNIEILTKRVEYTVDNDLKVFSKTLLRTLLRKKHTNGKWYLCEFVADFKYYHTNDNHKDEAEIKEYIIRSIKRLNAEIYQFQLLGIIDPDLTLGIDYAGRKAFTIDLNQEQETERIRRTILN